MKRFSFFVPSLGPGGVQRSMVILANGFASLGYRVDLVLCQAEGIFLPEVSEHVRVVELKARRILHSVPELARYLRAKRPHALVAGMTHVNVAALAARQLSGVKTRIVATLHSDGRGQRPGSLQGRILSALAVPGYRLADRVVGVSEGVSDYASSRFRLPRSAVTTIYNPIDLEQIVRKADLPITTPWLSQTSGALLVAVGRLVQQKDFASLLHAVAETRRTQAVRLAILGDGPERGNLQALAQQLGIVRHVHFAGFDANPYNWMRRADVFVMSSVQEGLPTVLIEAMACGAHIVSTDCPSGPREILEGGKWGRLVAPSDPAMLADAIISALSDPYPPHVGIRAADFDAPVIVERYLQLMDP